MMRMVEDYLGDQIVSQGRGKSAAKGVDVFVPTNKHLGTFVDQ